MTERAFFLGSQQRRIVHAPQMNFLIFRFAASRGQTNAGGEDFGYIAHW
jgi:hypothetical protein